MSDLVNITAVARKSNVRDDTGTPAAQFASIRAWAERTGRVVVAEHVEPGSTSGGTPLHKRKAILAAIRDVEDGKAVEVAVADRDRLDRDLEIRREIIRRVESAGGTVVEAATGKTITIDLEGTLLGAIDEDYRRVISRKVTRSQAERVAKGIHPGKKPKLGYRNPGTAQDPKPLEVVADEAKAVVEAFTMKADGASLGAIRAHLAAKGYDLSHTAMQVMFSRRFTSATLYGATCATTTRTPPS